MTWWRSPWYWALVAVVGAFSVVAIALQAPLSFDGSNYLFQIFDRARPMIPLGRYEVWLQQWPAVLAAKAGSWEATKAAFMVGYGATPTVLFAVAVALIWPLRRTHLPILIVGMLLTTFVSQPFFVSESVIALQLWWVAWAAFAPAGRSTGRNVLGSVFAVLTIFTYLPAISLVALLAIALLWRERAAVWPWVTVLAVAAAVRLLHSGGVSPEERDTVPHRLHEFIDPLGPVLIVGLALVLLGVVLCQLWRGPSVVGPSAVVVGLALVVAAAVFQRSYYGLEERAVLWLFAVPAAAIGCLFLVARPQPFPSFLTPVLMGTWAMAMIVALASWQAFFSDFTTRLASVQRCASPAPELRDRLHWSFTTLSYVVEGPHPTKVILWTGECRSWLAGDRPLYPLFVSTEQVGQRGGQFRARPHDG